MKLKKMLLNRLEHWQIIALLLVVYDIIAINIAFFAALWIRFDFSFAFPVELMRAWLYFVPV